jgi:hypothetical protein
MGDEIEFSKGYIKGYRDGLQDAWEELSKLASRGYSPTELQIMIRSSRPALEHKVEEKIAQIEKTLGRRLFIDETSQRKPVSGIELTPGTSILLREERPEKAPALIRSLLSSGSKLLSISRMHPEQLKTRFGLFGNMIWLTKSEYVSDKETDIEYVSPNSLPVLAEAIQQFLGKNPGGVIFLEGLEYMVSQNDPRSVLKFIQLINEQVLLRKGYLVLSANPIALDQRDFSLIEREMSQVA